MTLIVVLIAGFLTLSVLLASIYLQLKRINFYTSMDETNKYQRAVDKVSNNISRSGRSLSHEELVDLVDLSPELGLKALEEYGE